ncbi:MAG: hypothetical protein M0P58_04540 [Bacteroidales bacterium]|nr:hypothetical protein [Bacteroidales bacterium]
MRPKANRLVSVFLFLVLPVLLNAQKKIYLQKYQTENVRLVFLDKNTSYLVPHAVRSFENALAFHKDFWDYAASGETNILFNDFADVGNGGTMVIPWNFLNIGISPFDYTYGVVPSNERLQWLMSHELTHQVMCDKASKSDRVLQKIFGGRVSPDNRDPLSLVYSYFTTPRWYSPRWYHEGIAVFMETWMSGGIGRVMGGYDEMVFRTMVRDSSFFYNVIGLETEGTTIDFQVGVNSYLYGTRFVSYLAYHYGMEKLKEFYSRTDTSRRFYANQFKQVYGIPIQQEWDKWIKWEHGFQQENLAKIRHYPVNQYRKIVDRPLGSVSRTYCDKARGKLYLAVNYPGKLAHIASIDIYSGEMAQIAPVPSPSLYYVTSLAYDDSSKTLFASTHNNDWRGLQSIDINTGKVRELIRFDRAGNLVFNQKDKALYGIQSMNGRSILIRILPPYKAWKELYVLPFGKDFSDLDISPDGTLISGTLSDVQGKQKLVLMRISDLLAGKMEIRSIYEFEDNPAANFVFSPDGKCLYGTSYYTGVSNVFRISLETLQPQILTNATSGFFRPLPLSNDSMMVLDYSHEGMTPVMMKIDTLADVNAIEYLGQKIYNKYPEVENWMLQPPSKINLDSLKVVEKRYVAIKELKLASAYPIIQGYKDYIAVGYRLNFMDPMGLNALTIKWSFSPNPSLPLKQTVHLGIDYSIWNWTFTANYNYADFYDIFGPTKFSRAGYSLSARYYKLFNRFSPSKTDFYVKLTAYGDLETLPFYQNVASDYRNLYMATINYHKSYLRKSLGAIEPEQGYDWNVYAYTSFARQTFYPQVINNFDVGFLLPLRNSSLWFRTSAGQSFGESGKTNSYFYFGGFGNNWIDYRSAQQYREMSSFPGVNIDEISALNYGKLSAEINFRPIRFRKLGLLGFYSTYARFTVFGMGLFTNIANRQPQLNYFASGAQLDIELVLFSLLKSTLSLGYSRAYGPMLPADQFMVSLKL